MTGGTAAIGCATAFALARNGMEVGVVDLDAGAAVRVCEQLIASGHEALAIGAAVHDRTQVERAFKTIDEAWGGIDVLVKNVGISVVKPTLELTPQEWQHTLDVNLGSLFHCSQEAGRRMVARLSESIVNIGSIYTLLAAPKRGRLAEIARQAIVIEDTHYGRVEDVQMHIFHMLCYAFMEVPEMSRA
jgi:NAD(P)-dependent dehydrogenase (short-subunit alcohol dehydrogenase family)